MCVLIEAELVHIISMQANTSQAYTQLSCN